MAKNGIKIFELFILFPLYLFLYDYKCSFLLKKEEGKNTSGMRGLMDVKHFLFPARFLLKGCICGV